ncbi:TetR/AcrR family transcriptional regulator [Mycolicibacterium komossense]|uniref:TetR/AcrR family transcriptional regulator n=1 Tax=Mycolicibacterium komossense TaxID=1779 RepID=A0ABT3CKQ7_9MYCO|nr:TetR/AcrR family transcriptional regulator [Mycolicibacterium komossense]MCV7230079.1 TetR/AcrR family transcriptional regulator [Mycolicibacterium komossense]
MTPPADSARQQIMRAAAHQFANRSYSLVSLDDILREAEVTKGAMYFHFRSKHALALALIDTQSAIMRNTINDLLANKLSGLETLIDICFNLAMQEVTEDLAKSSLHLLEAIGRTEDMQTKRLAEWVAGFSEITRRAAEEGDLLDTADPADVSRLFVAMYAGIRQVSDLENCEEYLRHIERAWLQVMPGVVRADRLDYFAQFVHRRTAVAIRTVNRC